MQHTREKRIGIAKIATNETLSTRIIYAHKYATIKLTFQIILYLQQNN